MKFVKMQGAGNDYVYIEDMEQTIVEPEKLAKEISDRHFGVGSDGLVLILPSATSDFRMRMFNADGTEAEMCGNASRCIGKYVYDKNLTKKKQITLETKSGVKHLELHVQHREVESVTVDMGEPRLTPADIPVNSERESIIGMPFKVGSHQYRITCVSMGNPHAVIFTQNIDTETVHKVGPVLEVHPLFPQRTNVEFARIISPSHIKMRVWERGAGETLACGTGACATLVAGVLNGFCHEKATVELPGGTLEIQWDKNKNHVYMTGSAEIVFEGEWLRNDPYKNNTKKIDYGFN